MTSALAEEQRFIDGEWVTVEDLIEKHNKYIWKEVHRYSPKAAQQGKTKDDLYNSGAAGVVKAFRDFETERGLKFLTYAGSKIRGEITHELNRNTDLIHIPHYLNELMYKVKKAEVKDDPPAEIAERFNVSIDAVNQALMLMERSMSSLERPVGEDENTTLGEMIPGGSDDLSTALVDDFMQHLDEREANVLELTMQGFPNTEIGKKLGFSRSWPALVMDRIKAKYHDYQEGIGMAQGDLGKAKQLLSNTGKSVREIAEETGCKEGTVYYHQQRIRKDPDEEIIESSVREEPEELDEEEIADIEESETKETTPDYYNEYKNAIDNCNSTLKELHQAKERIGELEAELEKKTGLQSTVAQEYQNRINTLEHEKEAYRQAHKALEEAYTKKVALP